MTQKNMIKTKLARKALQDVRTYYKLNIIWAYKQITRSVEQNKDSENRSWNI